MTTAVETEQEIVVPEVASRLQNGAWVLASKPGRRPGIGEVPCAVVLGFHGGAGAVHPFAVWLTRPNGVAFWGHYFETIHEALADYAERR